MQEISEEPVEEVEIIEEAPVEEELVEETPVEEELVEETPVEEELVEEVPVEEELVEETPVVEEIPAEENIVGAKAADEQSVALDEALTLEEDEAAAEETLVGDAPSQDLKDYVNSVSISAEVDSSGNYVVRAGTEYTIDLNFAETTNREFPEDNLTMTYALPLGVAADSQSGTLDITVSDGINEYTVSYNTFSLDASTGIITYTWNNSDPNYDKLVNASNAQFSISFKGTFDGETEAIDFGNDVIKNVIVDDSHDLEISKDGYRSSEDGKFYYTITVKSTGVNTNVVVTDSLAGSALKYQGDAKVSGNSSAATDSGSSDTGFSLTFPSMKDGETVTIQYSAALDGSLLNLKDDKGELTKAESNNSVSVKGDDVEEKTKSKNFQGTSYMSISKDAETPEGSNVTTWTIKLNLEKLGSLAGMTVTDTIDEASREYVSYSGDGITVERSDGTSELIAWNTIDMTGDDDYNWSYTIPETDGQESYVITYTTITNTADLIKPLDVKNIAGVTEIGKTASQTSRVGVGTPLSISKKAESVTTSEVTWKITAVIPKGHEYSSVVVTDTYPNNSEWLDNAQQSYLDSLVPGSVSVDGLNDGYYSLDTNADNQFVLNFYKDAGKTETGLAASTEDRTIYITLKTYVDQNWLERSSAGKLDKDHKNHVKIEANGAVDEADGIATPVKATVSKKCTNQGTVTIDNITYPYYRYEVLLGGVNEDTITIEDEFDADILKVYEKYEWDSLHVFGGGQYSQDVRSESSATYSSTDSGATFTVDVPKNKDAYYAYYKFVYYLIVKDEAAFKTLQQRAADNDYTTSLDNTATYNNTSSEEVSVDYSFKPLNKVLLNESDLGAKNRTAKYQITLNPNGLTLNSGNDLTVEDSFSETLNILYDSIEFDNPEAVVTYNVSGHLATFIIKDATPLTITYSATVIGTGKKELSNTAKIDGQSFDVTKTKDFSSSGGGTASFPSIKVLKQETGKMDVRLENVEFQLYDAENDQPMTYGDGTSAIFKTDKNGIANVVGSNGLKLEFGKTYYLKEVEAPKGYELSTTKWKFTVVEKPEDVNTNAYIYPLGYTMRIANDLKTAGIILTKTFKGDVSAQDLTDTQKKAITFTVKKAATDDEQEKVVKTVSYDEFTEGQYSITKLEPGTYTVTESALAVEGYVLTKTFTVDGTETSDPATVEITTADTEEAKQHTVEVTNTYKENSISIELGGTKTLTGRDMADDEFTIKLTGSQNAPMPENGEEEVNVPGAKDGIQSAFSFGEIKFTEEGEYTYTVQEVIPEEGAEGITYDTSVYTITVSATMNPVTHLLEGTTTIVKTTSESEEPESTDSISFSNQYTGPETIKIIAEKKWVDTGHETERPHTVVFYLYKQVGENEPVVVDGDHRVIRDTKAAKQVVTWDNLPVKDGNQNEITYSVREKPIKGYVSKVSGDAASGFIVTNTYEVSSTSITLGGTKTFTGYPEDVTAPTFTYVLTETTEGSDYIDTKSTVGAGDYTFDAITYDTAGTYTYTVTETAGSASGVTYDTNEYTVTVVVTKDDSGDLTATISEANGTVIDGSAGTGLDFTNTYAPESTTAAFEAHKTLTGKDLTAGEFAFTLKDAGGVIQQTKYNDAEGNVTFDAFTYDAAGTYTYTVEENTAKTESGVTYSDEVYTVTVTVTDVGGTLSASTLYADADGTAVLTMEFENIYSQTSVKISKVDVANGKELEGATIQILDSEGTVVEEWTSTDEAHEVTGLKTGEEYTLKETVAPDGYTIATETTFTIDETGKVTSTGTVTEDGVLLVEDAKTEIRVSKVDIADGKEVAGATIQILDKDDNVVEEWTSTEKAHEVKGLKTGETYTLKETVAPDGYTIASETTFTIDETGKVTTTGSTTTDENGNVVMLVEDAKTKIKVSKVDIADGKEVAGATIQILDKNGKVVDEWTSTDEAHEVEGLKTGETYTLKETVAPDGYTIATETTFTIDETGKVTSTGTITEDGVLLVEDAKTEVRISKTDIADGKEVAGATIQILDKDGKVVEEWTSTDEAHVIRGLKTGETYTLKETVAPDGYTIASETTFTIDETGKVTYSGTTTTDENGKTVMLVEDAKTSVKISKIDASTGRPLAGATLQILDKDGKTVAEWTSTETVYEVKGLKTGEEYTLKETVAPDGYAVTKESTFTIDETGKVTYSGTTLTDTDGKTVMLVKDAPTVAKVLKVDKSTGTRLPGATIALLDKNGKPVMNEENKPIVWKSTRSAHRIIGLKTGETYILKEVAAPNGYSLAAATTFRLNADGTIDTANTTTAVQNGMLVIKDSKFTTTTVTRRSAGTTSVSKKSTGTISKKTTGAKTGDDNNIIPYLLLMAVAIGAIVVVAAKKKKKEN